MIVRPTSPAEVAEAVRTHRGLRPVAGRSKPALSAAPGATTLVDVSALSGILEYQPEECTLTARAGTPVAEVEGLLARHGQYLPCDPPLGARGATLGGTVASALSGPLRYRYGGVRDFLLGAHFVDGEGQIVHSGGTVVKNAAGFYLHHLLIGGLGRLGILLDVAFKVFPRPEAQTTVVASYGSFGEALAALDALRRSRFEPAAIDLLPPGRLCVRMAGLGRILPDRAASLAAQIGGTAGERLEGTEDETFWSAARELSWVPADAALVKVPVTAGRLAAVEEALAPYGPPRRYSAGGEVVWIAWRGALAPLEGLLTSLALPGLVVWHGAAGDEAPGDPRLGPSSGESFLARARQALDPRGCFA